MKRWQIIGLLVLAGCGVSGRPQPPLTPTELGRGQPTYKRATREFAFPEVPPVEGEAAEPTPTPTPEDNE